MPVSVSIYQSVSVSLLCLSGALWINVFPSVIMSFNFLDASVLLGNNRRHIFHILTSEDIDDVIYHFLH